MKQCNHAVDNYDWNTRETYTNMYSNSIHLTNPLSAIKVIPKSLWSFLVSRNFSFPQMSWSRTSITQAWQYFKFKKTNIVEVSQVSRRRQVVLKCHKNSKVPHVMLTSQKCLRVPQVMLKSHTHLKNCTRNLWLSQVKNVVKVQRYPKVPQVDWKSHKCS